MLQQKELDKGLSSYYRRMAALVKLIRFVVLLIFVFFCVYCIGFFRDNITMDNLRYVLKYIDLSGTDNTPSDTEIAIVTDESSSFIMLHNDLAAISNQGCELYDFAGNKLYSYNYAYSNAAAMSNGKNILVYDTEGKELAVYSSVSKVLEMELDYEIKSAFINDLGCLAVVNSEKTYRSGIIVFDRDGKEMFRWMSPDKYVTAVTLNANASEAVCTAVYNSSGSFVTELIVYNTATGEKKHTVTLNDTLGLKIGFAENDSVIYMLTQSRFMCFDKALNPLSSVEYNRNNAKFFKNFENCFVLAESNNLSGSSMTVSGYDYNGNLMFECETDDKVTDAAYSDATLYLLFREKMSVFDYDTTGEGLKEIAVLPLDKQYKAVRTDSYGRYILIGAKNVKRGSLAALLESRLND